jgi:hypothetical protein
VDLERGETDLSGAKVRPAVVVSPADRPGEDVILAFVPSVRPPALLATDLAIDASHPDFPVKKGFSAFRTEPSLTKRAARGE